MSAQTPREFLASQTNPATGQPYAIANSRGRFSAAAVALLEQARASGVVFAEPVKVTPAPKVKPAVTATATAPAPVTAPRPVVTAKADPKAVRAWAVTQGMTIGARGRIHGDVVAAYLAQGGRALSDTAPRAARVTPAAMPKVRRETTGYTFAPRPAGAGLHISEPLVRVSSCGACHKGVAYCTCKSGPVAPVSVGGGVLTLDKPV